MSVLTVVVKKEKNDKLTVMKLIENSRNAFLEIEKHGGDFAINLFSNKSELPEIVEGFSSVRKTTCVPMVHRFVDGRVKSDHSYFGSPMAVYPERTINYLFSVAKKDKQNLKRAILNEIGKTSDMLVKKEILFNLVSPAQVSLFLAESQQENVHNINLVKKGVLV